MKIKQIIAGIMGALLLLGLPAAADYSGDHPLLTVDQGKIKGDVLFLVEDNTILNYKTLGEASGPFGKKPNVTQAFTVSIPAGAVVKSARLYNYYNWARKDSFSYNPGAPAEADISFSSPAYTVGVHFVNPAGCDVTNCANPIVYPLIGTTHYWDSKGLNPDPTQITNYNFAFGTMAMDVTDMVTGSGTYTAKIEHASGGNTLNFVTYGFALLVIYEDENAAPIKYWVTEGADILWNSTTPGFSFTSEQATTTVLSAKGIKTETSELSVLAAGTDKPGTPSLTAILANGASIGGFPLVDGKALSLFDNVINIENAGKNVFSARDEGDMHTVFNAILVDRLGKDHHVREAHHAGSEESDEHTKEPCARGEQNTCE
jgi:hypothetical protein